jgi:hypothetical protein
VQSELVQGRALEPGRIPVDDQQGQAAVGMVGGPGDDDDEVGVDSAGDEGLGAR